jgi:hypothetical protein
MQKGNGRAVVLIALSVIIADKRPLETQNASVAGVVEQADGEPLSGGTDKDQ